MFCSVCGQRLKRCCPGCAAANPPIFQFCGFCGRSLTPAATTSQEYGLKEKINALQRYLPKELSSSILTEASTMREPERKHVTIMFCDISEFTSMTEVFGADLTFSLIDKIFSILIEIIGNYQGVVNELRGDGILAFFGAPLAMEDAPQRAIRASLAIHKAIASFNREESGVTGNTTKPVLLRIGINTGLVVVGNVGNEHRLHYTAMGEAINIAARIEKVAIPGTTFVSTQTYKLTEGYFRFEDCGPYQFKGKQDPVRVYRVISTNTRRTRFDVNAERGLTPLVGRQRELHQLWQGFARAREGAGQAFFVVSEAGMGKSRLLYEFRKAVSAESVLFIEGKCLSYSATMPYHLVIDLLKSVFHLDPAGQPTEHLKRIESVLGAVSSEYRSALPHILELLSIKADGRLPADRISPEEKKERIHEILGRMVVKGCARQPLVLACEDLHWMDANSGEALGHILELIANIPVLLVFTFRTEFIQPWQDRHYCHTLPLERLTSSENLAIARAVLGNVQLSPVLIDLIQAKTEGIPFFTEEFVRSLLDLAVLKKSDNHYTLGKPITSLKLPVSMAD